MKVDTSAQLKLNLHRERDKVNFGEQIDLRQVQGFNISDAKDARHYEAAVDVVRGYPIRPRIQCLNHRRERTILCEEERRTALRFGSKAAQIGISPESFCVLLTSQRRSVHFSLLAMQTYVLLMSAQLDLEL